VFFGCYWGGGDCAQADLPVERLAELNAGVAALIAADVPLAHFELPTAEALTLYDAAFVETSRRPDASVTTLDLVYVPEVLLFYATAPLLPSAGYLESVDVQRVRRRRRGGVCVLYLLGCTSLYACAFVC
jgi:hypothetical protein